MFYTITLVVENTPSAKQKYAERVYLFETDIDDSGIDFEEKVMADFTEKLDSTKYLTILEYDVRPILFEDFSESVYAKHFSNIEAYQDIWHYE